MTRFWLRIPLIILLVCAALALLAFGAGAILPSGGELSFTSQLDGDLDIYLIDLGRGIRFNLTDTPDNEWQADWSPDGTQIVFISDRDGGSGDIYTQTVACGGLFAACAAQTVRITNNPGGDYYPTWSPDGQHIAFVSDQFGYGEIFVADLVGGVPLRLTENDAHDVNPAWSPDGAQIAFASNRDNPDDVDLYMMTPDGGSVRHILENPGYEFAPSWSLDGQRIAFGTFDAGGNRQLAILDLESITFERLLDDRGNDDTPDFSPDGQTLAFMSYPQSGNAEVFIMRLACVGGRAVCAQRLTFFPGWDADPHWRPVSR